MKRFCLFGIGLLVVAAWARAASPVPPATSAARPEDALRTRVHDFNQAMLKARYDDAVKFIDPETTAAVGEEAVRDQLKQMMGTIKGFAAIVGRKITGFTVRKVDIAKNKTDATVGLGFFSGAAGSGADRVESPSEQKWVLKNKLWYFVK